MDILSTIVSVRSAIVPRVVKKFDSGPNVKDWAPELTQSPQYFKKYQHTMTIVPSVNPTVYFAITVDKAYSRFSRNQNVCLYIAFHIRIQKIILFDFFSIFFVVIPESKNVSHFFIFFTHNRCYQTVQTIRILCNRIVILKIGGSLYN